jgi:hypothetical protein
VTPRLPQDASAGDLKTPTGPLIKSQRVCRALTNGWEMFNEMQAKGARHAPRTGSWHRFISGTAGQGYFFLVDAGILTFEVFRWRMPSMS